MRRELVDFLMTRFNFSQRRACRLVGIGVSVYRYKQDTSRDDKVIKGLQGVVCRYPAYGFGKLFKVLRREGLLLESQASTQNLLPVELE